MFNLGNKYKECSGGHGGGMYIGDFDARVWGPKDLVFVLGFANGSMVQALRDQIASGDLPKTMRYAGETVSPGRDFDAFIIPESAPSITRYATREEADIG